VTPSVPAEEDFFLHVLEIGEQGKTGGNKVRLVDGVNFQGAALEAGPLILFSSTGPGATSGELSLPEAPSDQLIITGLEPNALYEINFGGPNVSSSPKAVLPGVSAGTERYRANATGILRISENKRSNLRMRIASV
jgi:hypothetical protein